MNDNLSRLELLPNETLSEIFEYFDARDLYRTFYNINFRFNTLLQSLNHLCLTLSTFDPNENINNEIFCPYIRILIIKKNDNIPLCHFTNVRRLIWYYFSNSSFENWRLNILPNLEHLSVISTTFSRISFPNNLIQRIFSNEYPYLKSCYLPKAVMLKTNEGWTQSSSLCILKIGWTTFPVYKTILSSCPNLYFLVFSKWPLDETTFHIEPHINLKRMVVNLPLDNLSSHHHMKDYFSCVSNLEYLTIHLYLFNLKITEFIQNDDWFASIIACNLPILRRFSFYLHSPPSHIIKRPDNRNICSQIEENFKQMHNNRYKSRIIIK